MTRMDADNVPVSIHAPTGGATRMSDVKIIILEFQFTRPQGARRKRSYNNLSVLVSIHAPTGGATFKLTVFHTCCRVSIHAPTGGATEPEKIFRKESEFQFTRPQGARHFLTSHSPNSSCFNSRAHRGRDTLPISIVIDITWFQFTRPQGARHPYTMIGAGVAGFNSRAHRGRDVLTKTKPTTT